MSAEDEAPHTSRLGADGRPWPTFNEALAVWGRIAVLSFGGPAGQIAVMHRILVEEKRWLGEARFLHALNFCMLLPGPEAQQLAVYFGWLMHRTAGGVAAGLLFVFPGLIAIMILSLIYALYGDVSFVAAMFFGLKAAVLAIVLHAVARIGKARRPAGRPARQPASRSERCGRLWPQPTTRTSPRKQSPCAGPLQGTRRVLV